MFYIYIVVLESSILHAKFRRNQFTGTGEEDILRVFTIHYENLPMQYTEIFKVVKNENFQ